MKRISSYMKNTSIRMQLLSIFVAIGVAISIVTVISLSLNHQIMEKHGRNLEYISMINTLSEVNDESKDLLGELWREPPKLEKKEVIEIAQVVTTLIENIRLKTTSVDISLRLRVIEYLFEQYETKSLALIDLLEQEKVSLSQSKESSFQYTL